METCKFKCAQCGKHYKDKAMAAKCREWCKTHPACNPTLAKKAVSNKGKGIDGCTYC